MSPYDPSRISEGIEAFCAFSGRSQDYFIGDLKLIKIDQPSCLPSTGGGGKGRHRSNPSLGLTQRGRGLSLAPGQPPPFKCPAQEHSAGAHQRPRSLRTHQGPRHSTGEARPGRQALHPPMLPHNWQAATAGWVIRRGTGQTAARSLCYPGGCGSVGLGLGNESRGQAGLQR